MLGPRRTGKSFFLTRQLQPDAYYNLLEADTFRKLSSTPELIRQSLKNSDRLIAIDEIQKLPVLMDEVHSMIESKNIRFILTGSSARKLSRNYTSLMAGRARKIIFHPLSHIELGNYDLNKRLLWGSLPPVVTSDEPLSELKDYTGLYLRDEIQAEAYVRKIENFSRFLDFSAMSSGHILNYEKIGRDAQVPARTIREYYSLLEDTLMGKTLEPLKKKGKRKAVATSKFYLFDTGVLNNLLGRKELAEKGEEFGHLFEHFIFNELDCYRDYSDIDIDISYWRLEENCEVDFVINGEVAIEVKSSLNIQPEHLKGLQRFAEEFTTKRRILVSRDPTRRKIGEIELIPWKEFLDELWTDQLIT